MGTEKNKGRDILVMMRGTKTKVRDKEAEGKQERLIGLNRGFEEK